MALDGKWTGYYRLVGLLGSDDPVFPIEADFRTEDGVLTGSMKDHRIEFFQSIADRILPKLPKMSALEQFRWKQTLRASPTAYMRIVQPMNSTLVCQSEGDRLTFLKRYIGDVIAESVYSYFMGDSPAGPIYYERIISKKHPCREVTYCGTLDATGTIIRGSYDFPGHPEKPGNEFELHRVE